MSGTQLPLWQRIIGRFTEDLQEKVARSYALQSKEERQVRLRTVMALSVELDRIRRIDSFSTRLAEGAVEAVIEGDWRNAAHYVEHMAFGDEDPDLRNRYAPLWEGFRDILRAAVEEAAARNVAGSGLA